jgi:thioester reductase-like protein
MRRAISRSASGFSIVDPPVSLVTGYPAFTARHLVEHLLGGGGDDVWAVVRAADAERALERRSQMGLERAQRLVLIPGDPTSIDLGLSGPDYRSLAGRARRLFHLSHSVESGGSRERAEAENVGGMREALELCRAAPALGCLVVHSSVAVSGDRVGRVAERDLVMQQRFVDPMEETLARAELMARRSMDHLPIVVLRTGQVVGDRETGAVDALDGVYLLLLLILSSHQDLSPALPSWGDAPIHAVPVDHLARVAVGLSSVERAFGQTLHLTEERPMTIRMAFNRCMKIRKRLLEEGFSMPPVARLLGRDTPLRHRLQSILWRPRAFVSSTFRDVSYDTTVARGLLAEAGLPCPALETYFERLVRHVARSVSELNDRA